MNRVHNRLADKVASDKWQMPPGAAATPEDYIRKKWGPGIKRRNSVRSKSRYSFANQGAGKKRRKTKKKRRKTGRKKSKTRRKTRRTRK
jgi:hypothetical protein